MTTLTVWKFDSEGGARDALQVLERLQKQELIQIVDGAIVTWPPDRKKPKTEQRRSLGGVGALGGAFWGLLFGLLFFIPLIGMAIGAAMGALAGSDLRNRLRIMPVNWHFRNRLVPKSDEVRSGPTPYRRAGRIHHQVHHRRD